MATPTREKLNDNISSTVPTAETAADSSSSSGDSRDDEIDRGFLKDQPHSVDVSNLPSLFLDSAVSSDNRGDVHPGAMFCDVPHATGAVSRMNPRVHPMGSNEWRLNIGLESLKAQMTCLSTQFDEAQKAHWQEVENNRRTWITVGVTVAGIALIGAAALSATYQLTGIYRNLRG